MSHHQNKPSQVWKVRSFAHKKNKVALTAFDCGYCFVINFQYAFDLSFFWNSNWCSTYSITWELSCMSKPTAIHEVPLHLICIPAIGQLKLQLWSSPATSSLEREWRDSPHHECFQTGSLDDPVLPCALSDRSGGFQPHWEMQELAVHGNSPAGDSEH